MPELPEVQTVVDSLRIHLLSRTISRVELARTDIVTPSNVDLAELLTGRTIVNIHRRAKRIIFTLDSNHHFYIHLGMSGRISIESASIEPKKHTHFQLHFDDQTVMRFSDPRRFGGIWWLGDELNSDEEKTGPEPLTLTARDLGQRLLRTRRVIKSALLDQRLIAGLGNIYVDESLFSAGIHPLTPSNKLRSEQVMDLSRSIKATLRRALQHRGSTLRDYRDANGNVGDFQNLHRVYARENQPCVNCGTPIQRIVITGRSTHFCPQCQRKRSKRR